MILAEKGVIVAGCYELDRQLAHGGMGSVWLARHLRLDVPVVVKLMAKFFGSTSDGITRFRREAKAAAKLKSPYIVQVHDYGVEDETPYIVLEHLHGEDLGARLKREHRLSLEDTAVIVAQLCKGLRAAHAARIVHRDLKPGNVFLAKYQEDEVAKIIDFGIAKSLASSGIAITATDAVIGTPQYMSPEQLLHPTEIDHRTDLWSISVIIYRCLTGQLPFQSHDINEMMINITRGSVPRVAQLAPEFGLELDRFFEQGLASDKTQRFQDAGELAGAFARVSDAAARSKSASPPQIGQSQRLLAVSNRVLAKSHGSPAPLEVPSLEIPRREALLHEMTAVSAGTRPRRRIGLTASVVAIFLSLGIAYLAAARITAADLRATIPQIPILPVVRPSQRL